MPAVHPDIASRAQLPRGSRLEAASMSSRTQTSPGRVVCDDVADGDDGILRTRRRAPRRASGEGPTHRKDGSRPAGRLCSRRRRVLVSESGSVKRKEGGAVPSAS